ncbi:TetR family transcriptional regulator [Homoserinimonas aerilata]|uniref:TetR family transcriptional regulator n=1 Tax=Homoserinimonas aerilata TaxID=1162970 RepID=A0A542YEP3_9MICO|nr:TetR/AcrR family transcriptional regulator [Homoserinimonas aerilata]TQL46558.1 TetR family transcriptional regulator [Homoserinimonas aerilata]
MPQENTHVELSGRHEVLDEVEPLSARKLANAALDSFFTAGYGGTTTRHISEQAGMSTGSLYSSFRSKEEILFLLARLGHESALRALREAAGQSPPAASRVRGMIYEFTIWHARNHRIARVSQYQLAALTPQHHAIIAGLRHEIEAVLQTEVEAGVAQGEFDIDDIKGFVLAALSLGIDVARWFSPEGRLTPEALATSYADLAMRMLRPTNH